MLKNYFKIAFRNLFKNKMYSVINILGLSVGLSACLLIGLYVHHELSYDDFHENSERIYRVNREFNFPNLKTTISSTPSALAPTLKESLTAIEVAVRVIQDNLVVRYGTNNFVESSFIFAEDGFFDMFSFPIIQGQAELGRPSTIVISESMVSKYFPNENPLGKSLHIGNGEMEVTGVFADIPDNSHLQFDFVGSLGQQGHNWGYNNYITYILLREGYTKESLTPDITSIIKTNVDPDNNQDGNGFIPHLQPISGIHLGQGIAVEIGAEGNIMFVYLFIALAIFILLMACINYINMSTARATERSREVGMRKALGADRAQIVLQFLGESIITTVIALIIALGASQIAIPFLNDLSGKSLDLNNFIGGTEISLIAIVTLIIGIIAGLYPAFMLSRFTPSDAVKGASANIRNDFLRKSLVVFQFSLSISLIVATTVVYQQLDFMKSSGLGFDEENIVLIEQANFLGTQTETFKQELQVVAGVKKVTSGFSMPGKFFFNSMLIPENDANIAQNMNYTFVDFNYLKTLDIELVAGRDFSEEYSTDSSGVILNEISIKNLGWAPDDAIGKELSLGSLTVNVIGVAQDFHYSSLHSEIYPLALFGPIRAPRLIGVKISDSNIPETLTRLETLWDSFSSLPFEFSFLADDLAAQYRSEDRLAKVFAVFAGLAILIGCLGLFGLVAFMASKRMKEIGIRKILGATVVGIVGLLSKDFLKLVAIGFAISIPIAWFGISQWLMNFPYRVSIGVNVFLLAGGLALLVAILTVCWQSIKAAVANPVKSLRSE